jgi:hypothetical protein
LIATLVSSTIYSTTSRHCRFRRPGSVVDAQQRSPGSIPLAPQKKKIKYAARIFFPLALVCPASPALPPASQWRPKTAGVDVGYSAARAPSHTLRPAPYRYLPRLTRMCNSASVHVARRGQPHVRAGGSGHAPLATTIGTPVATLLHALLTCPPVPPPVPLL